MEEKSWGPVSFIPGKNSGRYPYCHSLYIQADRKIIVDPASDRGRLLEIKNGPGVDQVWLSHFHEDHIKYLNIFDDLELFVAEADAPPLGGIEHFLEYSGMQDPSFRDSWSQTMAANFGYHPRRPAGFLEAGTVDLGGLSVDVIPTPGHTLGHTCLFFRDLDILFLGDYDLTRFGPWYGDKYVTIDQVVDSVDQLRKIPARVWLTGHEDGVFEADPGPLWDDYLRVIDERDALLLDLLREPRDMDQIAAARIIYKKPREPKDFYDFGEKVLMGKHLDRFVEKGIVVKENGRFRLK
ncbi:MAG: MBL fold metallo-hydrolase [Pseudomonadota bacterium]